MNDAILENDETTTLEIGGVIGLNTINDAGDAIPVVNIEATTDSATEGVGDSIVFAISQTGATDKDSNVTATLNLGDIDASDIDSITFTDANGTQTISVADAIAGVSVSIPAGSSILPTFTITPNDDAIYEVSEALSMSISNALNAAIGTATDSATIFDEDATDGTVNEGDKPTVTVGDASAIEGDTLVHSVTVNGVTEADVTYDFDLAGNSATEVTDFTNVPVFSDGVTYDAATGTITVPAGVTDFTVSYPALNDAILENDETTTLEIGGVIGTGTINDAGDAIPVVNIEATTDSATEGVGDSIVFAISQTGATDKDSNVTATLNLGDIDASDIDSITFTDANGTQTISVADAIAGVSVSIPAGSSILPTFTITPNDDAIYEVSEALSMSISNAINASIGTATDSATIFDEDATDGTVNEGDKPTVTVGDASAIEGDTLVHSVTVNGVTEADVTYDFDLTDGSATAGDYSSDPADLLFSNGVTYDPVAGTITVPAGVTDFTVSYPALNDAILENDETTTLEIGGVIGTETINDAGDAIPVVNIEATTDSATEGVGDSIVFAISQTGATDKDSNVTATLNLGDIDASDIDSITFTDANGTQTISVADAIAGVSVSIPAGSSILPIFTITPNDDAIYEVSEALSMSISNALNASIGPPPTAPPSSMKTRQTTP
ncbi:beta strand repeat-containing protein [Psychrobacter fjordensis]|uniref:beta strand repeat-containing protein n=1 Tax=Psychrobacter fjordensis TaxID=664424 RepID=UPI001919FA98|nr:Calx-beta domain-containing protein [Psychrobacter fjordensis]